jgi:mRNA-degrading endonuclease toxin of MazEF toxin-antitoxin module
MEVAMKQFNEWMKLKHKLNNSISVLDGYKEREIWWTAVGQNIGTEEDGKNSNFGRPVLIVKGFSQYLFWGVPLSTTKKRGKYYHPFVLHNTTSVALLSQLRAFDTRRLLKKHGTIGYRDFIKIKNRLREFLG